MSEIITLPDARLSRAVDDICQILYGIEPAIHTATALGVLRLSEEKIIARQKENEQL